MIAVPWASTHLDRRQTSIVETATESLGLYVSPPVSHLELAARIPGYRAADLESLMEERRLIGLRTLRGSAFLMPTELLPVVVPATRERNVRAFGSYLRKNLSGSYDEWVRRVLDVIEPGEAVARADITARLAPDDSDRPFMGNLINQLATESRLIGVRVPSSWRSARLAYTRWSDWLPDVDVESPDPGDARATLARWYFDAFGPATIADFAWWSGLTKAQSRAAAEAVEVPPIDDRMFGQDDVKGDPPSGVRLLPIWDTLFVTWKDRSRFIPDHLLPFVYDASGNATSVVLIDGEVAGVWAMGPDDDPLEVRVAPFDSFDRSQWAEVEQEAEVVAALAGSAEARVVRLADPPNLVEGPRNLFMRPI